MALVHAVPPSVSAVQVSNTVEPRRFSIRDGQAHHMLVVIVVWLVVERVTAVHPTDSKSPSPANLSEQKNDSFSHSCGANTDYCGGGAVVVVPAPAPAPAIGQCRLTGCPAGSCCSQYG